MVTPRDKASLLADGIDRTRTVVDFDAITKRPTWHADAACKEHPELTWFPERGQDSRPAIAVCTGCLVRYQCAEYALADPTLGGIFGGLTERARRRIRQATHEHERNNRA